MENLNTIKMQVKAILEIDRRARNSDSFLYFRLLEIYGNKNGFDINEMPVTTFLLNMSEYGFPAFESVRRTRQKVQQECPELAASGQVYENRMKHTEDYRNFARGW